MGWHRFGFVRGNTYWLGRGQLREYTLIKITTMHKIKHFAFGALMLGIALSAGQSTFAADEEVNYQPFSLRAEAGTLGLGVSAGWRFADHFGVHAGVNYFSHSENGNDIEGTSYNSKLRLLSVPLALDIYPWENRSFRFSVGALINKNKLTGSTPLGQPVELNGNTYQDAGLALTLEGKQKVFSPFISLGGDFALDKAKHWALNFELGVAYTGNPEVALTRTSTGPDPFLDADLEAERQQLEDKAKDFKFYPIVKVGVSFSF